MSEKKVTAAGGVVVDGQGRVLLVHRPRYDDWTFPKGKLDSGESIEECALREVEEETGYSCELGDHLTTVRYRDNKGRKKDVHFWRMRPEAGAFEPNDEVDEIRWTSAKKAARLLSYQRDIDVLVEACNGKLAITR